MPNETNYAQVWFMSSHYFSLLCSQLESWGLEKGEGQWKTKTEQIGIQPWETNHEENLSFWLIRITKIQKIETAKTKDNAWYLR